MPAPLPRLRQRRLPRGADAGSWERTTRPLRSSHRTRVDAHQTAFRSAPVALLGRAAGTPRHVILLEWVSHHALQTCSTKKGPWPLALAWCMGRERVTGLPSLIRVADSRCAAPVPSLRDLLRRLLRARRTASGVATSFVITGLLVGCGAQGPRVDLHITGGMSADVVGDQGSCRRPTT